MKKIITLPAFLFFIFSSLYLNAQINTTSQWTWMKGDSTAYNYGNYGMKGIAAVANKPGSRYGSAKWTDNAGNFWLFGGEGYAAGSTGLLNDLWKYAPSTNQWTWIAGDSSGKHSIYGTKGVAGSANKPGSRTASTSWTDASGNFWLFGGLGLAGSSSFQNSLLNDLWKYNPATNQWTWISGDTIGNQIGIYGTMGIPAANNKPGARWLSSAWTDNNGNFWLFGGVGKPDNNSGESSRFLNDLWKYNPSTNQWTWVKGSSQGYLSGMNNTVGGVYGTLGVPAAANTPGGRSGSVYWRDSNDNFWLAGGNEFNDLWKYNLASNQWAWVNGDSIKNRAGVYGVQGVASTANKPGGRNVGNGWMDVNGKFWLFGGQGNAANGEGFLNDLWDYNPATNQWTWVKGDSIKDQPGVYGTQGVASTVNKPGARYLGVTWTDASGNFWLFGGNSLNDLWRLGDTSNLPQQPNIFVNDARHNEGNSATSICSITVGLSFPTPAGGVTFNIATADSTAVVPGDYIAQTLTGQTIPAGNSTYTFNVVVNGDTTIEADETFKVNIFNVTGAVVVDGQGVATIVNDDSLYVQQITTASQWAWMKGDNTINELGVYGTQGVAATANKPGARYGISNGTSASGNFRLFGGRGYGISNSVGDLNDLWEYNPATNQWAWVKGAYTPGQMPTFGTQGIPASANTPGGRSFATSWTDTAGNFWLFGGTGHYIGTDLWKYAPATNQWVWVTGSYFGNQIGVYGTSGTPTSANTPGPRISGVSWTDANGNLWLFGGRGTGRTLSNYGFLNDLWKYNPATNQWAWMNGADTVNQPGIYGTMGVAAATNRPGARYGCVSWADNAGNLWLFGGSKSGYTDGCFNDLWKYDIAANQWTWVKGDSITSQLGVYGTMGIPATANRPGARYYASSWADGAGNLWLFGGSGVAANSSNGYWLNDLWKYNIATNQWTWIKGANTLDQPGVYGTLGVPAAANRPGARQYAVSWKDNVGSLWLFGGTGLAASGGHLLNDLWKLSSTNVSFVSVNSGSWNNPSTWAGGVIPSANSLVVVRNAITISANASCYSLRVEGPNGNVTVAPGVQFTVLH